MKRGVSMTLLWVFYVLFAFFIFFVLLTQTNKIAEAAVFNEKVTSLDVALLMDTVNIAPNDIDVEYSSKLNVKFGEGEVRIGLTNYYYVKNEEGNIVTESGEKAKISKRR